jgi:hypothetical protein
MDTISEWLSFFAGSCIRACNEIMEFADKAGALEQKWRVKIGAMRRNSSLDLMLGKLMGMPVFTVATASRTLNRSYTVTNQAIEKLVAAGVVKPMGTGRRNRAFEVPEVLDAFGVFERKLATPAGNTKTAKPVRTVPYLQ